MKDIYQRIEQHKLQGIAQVAVLIDPDGFGDEQLRELIDVAVLHGVDYFLVGGTLFVDDRLEICLQFISERCDTPTLLFPGNTYQLSDRADGILLLSLISGRNPELLIGKHVLAAPYLAKSDLEIISCGYVLVDGGAPTSVSYMSNTKPIPANKPDIAKCTALAGQYLGLKSIYLEAGSGAKNPVPPEMIRSVCASVDVPLIVGGGIRSPEQARRTVAAGADVVVIGSILEQEPESLGDIVQAIRLQRAITR